MDDIFAQARNILIVWVDDVDPEHLPAFEEIVAIKAKQAQITSENIQILLQSQHPASSADMILFGLVSKNKSAATDIDIINEFFRLLRPNGYLVTHLLQIKETQAIGHFKMCGFSNCNPLDSNSSFLIQNKEHNIKRLGTLWLCRKPPFDIGYSVSLSRERPCFFLHRSVSGGKKTWRIEKDDSIDEIDAQESPINIQKSKPNEYSPPQSNVTSGRNSFISNTFRSLHAPARDSSPFKSSEYYTVPKMSDV